MSTRTADSTKAADIGWDMFRLKNDLDNLSHRIDMQNSKVDALFSRLETITKESNAPKETGDKFYKYTTGLVITIGAVGADVLVAVVTSGLQAGLSAIKKDETIDKK